MKNWLLEKRWRIILSGMVIVALPIVALSSFVYFVLVGHVRETVIEAEKNATIEIASHIQDRIRDNIRAGKLIASRPLLHKAIKSADRKELTSRLKSLVDNVVTIERAFITSPKAISLANYDIQLQIIGKDLSDKEWYKGVSKSRQPYVSEFYLRLAEPKRYLFSIAIPIKTEKQEVVGILVLQPEADYIKNALSHMLVISGQKVYLIDKKGNLIFHSDYAVDRIIDFSGIPVVQKVLRGEDGLETIKQDGVNTVTAYHPIEELGWGVIVQRPEKEVLGHLRKINLALFIFAGVMLLVGAYFATKRSDLLFSLRRISDELEERVEERTGELKMAKKDWESTFDAIADPIFIHDQELKIVRANRAYQEAAGMPFEEIIGKRYYEVFPKMRCPLKTCQKALKLQEAEAEEEEVYDFSTGRIFNIKAFSVRDEGYRYSVHIMEDITEEKRAMEALSESEEKFRTMTASAKDAIIVIGNEGEVVSWNNAAEKISGYSAGDAMGKELHMFFAPERYRAAYREGFRRFRETGEGAAVGKTLELAALRKDGTEFPVELSISAVKLKGKWNAIGILRDITERKQAEQKLKGYAEHLEEMVRARTKELEDANVELQAINKELDLRKAEADEAKLQADTANKAKSDFLANMSHELRTPLNSVIGFAEVLEDQYYGTLNEKQKEYVKDIHISGKHLLNLINDILDLSKVEAGKMELELGDVSIFEVLHSSITMFKEKAMKHSIKLTVDIAPDADMTIQADERKMKQIVFNLLSNAMKFTPDGGSVSVSARRVKSSEFGVHGENRG